MGAQWGGGDVNEVKVGVEFGAETRAELGEGGAVGAWKGGFRRVYLGGGGIEDSVVAEGEDGAVYCGGMEVGDGVLVGGGREGAIV